MSNGANVFDVIKGLSFLVAWNSTQRFSWINALENTKTTKVFESHLQEFQTLGSSNERSLQPSMFLLLLLAHARQLSLASRRRAQGRLDRLFLDFSLDTVPHGDVSTNGLLSSLFSGTSRDGDPLHNTTVGMLFSQEVG